MSPRQGKPPLAAAYQLMANYLVWDLRDLLEKGELSDPNGKQRIDQLIEMLEAAGRAAEPAHPGSHSEVPRQGGARAERTKRMESLSRDQELLNLVFVARGAKSASDAGQWASHAAEVLISFERGEWSQPKEGEGRSFIANDVEAFLQRLQRIDEDDAYRPTKRNRLTRR
jgi:hypothetical protein